VDVAYIALTEAAKSTMAHLSKTNLATLQATAANTAGSTVLVLENGSDNGPMSREHVVALTLGS
jgi:hypothetical protein